LTNDDQAVVNAGPGGRTRRSNPQRVDQQAGSDFFGLGELLQRGFDRFERPVGQLGENRAKLGQQCRNVAIGDSLLERLFVVLDFVLEKVTVRQDVAGNFDSVAE
jgi:hypothetical protein